MGAFFARKVQTFDVTRLVSQRVHFQGSRDFHEETRKAKERGRKGVTGTGEEKSRGERWRREKFGVVDRKIH